MNIKHTESELINESQINDSNVRITKTILNMESNAVESLSSISFKQSKNNKNGGKKNKQKIALPSNFKAIKYQKGETIRNQKIDGKMYMVQMDTNFVGSIEQISKSRITILQQIIKFSHSNIAEMECEQIHYKARLHSQANIINTNSGKSEDDILKNDCLRIMKCQCGCNRLKGQYFPLNTKFGELSILGPGVLLFFYFLKAITIYLLLICVLYSLFAITTNLMGSASSQTLIDNCSTNLCTSIISLSDYNKIDPKMNQMVQSYLGLISMIIWAFLMKILFVMGKRQNKAIDKNLDSDSDYAIKISNLPSGTYEQHLLITSLNQLIQKSKQEQQKKQKKQKQKKQQKASLINKEEPKRNIKIKSIQIIYNMEFARKLISKIIDNSIKVLKVIQKKQGKYIVKNHSDYLQLKHDIIQNYQLFKDLRKNFLHDAQFRKKISANSCIIEFKHQSDKNKLIQGKRKAFLTKVKNSCLNICHKKSLREGTYFYGNQLIIERAPQPSDILWENCEKQISMFRGLVIYFASFLITVISFAIIAGLQYIQLKIINQQHQQQIGVSTALINISIGISLQLINKILWFSLTAMIQLQHNHTKTDAIISQMTKSSVMMWINIIALPIIISYTFQQNFYGIHGISGIVFTYHFSALFINLSIKMISPLYTVSRLCLSIKNIRNYIIKKEYDNVVKNQGSQKHFIVKINKLYQCPDFDTAQSYVFVTSNIIQAVFFCQLQPIILIFVLFQCLYFFWICKYDLLRRTKIPEITDFLIFQMGINLLMMVPIFFGLGSLFINYVTNQNDNERTSSLVIPIVIIILGLWLCLDPYNLLKKLAKEAIKLFKKQSSQAKKQTTYSGRKANKKKSQIVGLLSLLATAGDRKSVKRKQNYFQNSNSLVLLGFQQYLRGQTNLDQIQEQLKSFCASFIPRSHRSMNDFDADSSSSENANCQFLQQEIINDQNKKIKKQKYKPPIQKQRITDKKNSNKIKKNKMIHQKSIKQKNNILPAKKSNTQIELSPLEQ